MNTTKLRAMNLGAVADELEQLREFKDTVESQEPSLYKVFGKYRGGPSGTFYYDASDAGRFNAARHKECGDEVVEYFSRPVPADKPVVRITDEMISRAMSVVIGSSGDYGTYNEYLSKEAAREVLEAALSAELTSQKPARITEQDAREICTEYNNFRMDGHGMTPYEIINKWLRSEGRTLLNKLNADRQVSDETSDQKLWDYYQTLLKHYGFDGITDLLVNYRKLAEQVPVVEDALQKLRLEVAEAMNILAMCGNQTPVDQLGKKLAAALNASALPHSQQSILPDAATPEMEAAAERYWNERWCTGLTDDPRTWAGVYAAMVAAYRKGE